MGGTQPRDGISGLSFRVSLLATGLLYWEYRGRTASGVVEPPSGICWASAARYPEFRGSQAARFIPTLGALISPLSFKMSFRYNLLHTSWACLQCTCCYRAVSACWHLTWSTLLDKHSDLASIVLFGSPVMLSLFSIVRTPCREQAAFRRTFPRVHQTAKM